jgi:hypothetical protein
MEGGHCDPDRSAHDAPPPVRLDRALPHPLQGGCPARAERPQRRRRALRRLPQREALRARPTLHRQRPRLRFPRPATQRAPRRSLRGRARTRRRDDRLAHRLGTLALDPEQRQRQPDHARRVQPPQQHAARGDRHRRPALLALVPAHADAPLQRRLLDTFGTSLRALPLAVPVHLQATPQRSTRCPARRAACRPRFVAPRPLRAPLAFRRRFFDRLLAPVLHAGCGARRAAACLLPLVTFWWPPCVRAPSSFPRPTSTPCRRPPVAGVPRPSVAVTYPPPSTAARAPAPATGHVELAAGQDEFSLDVSSSRSVMGTRPSGHTIPSRSRSALGMIYRLEPER